MSGLATGMITAAAGRIFSGLLERVSARKPSFAEVLEAVEARHAAEGALASWVREAAFVDSKAAEISALAERLLDLPITSGEARWIASELAAVMDGLKENAQVPGLAERVEKAVAKLVSGARSRFMLSPQDVAKLNSIAKQYAGEALSV